MGDCVGSSVVCGQCQSGVAFKFIALVGRCDGIIIASPEYARSIPGGLKNAVDWLVSGDELIGKPIALMHASHRGDDMLSQLRLVLSTVSEKFSAEAFTRFDLIGMSPERVAQHLTTDANRAQVGEFFETFVQYCKA
ncbi:MAG: NADPH-dependent FMN reductase [Paracoccaceae bacterium]